MIRRLKRRAKHHAHVGTHIRQDHWMRRLKQWRNAGFPDPSLPPWYPPGRRD